MENRRFPLYQTGISPSSSLRILAGYAAWQAVINGCDQGETTCDRIHVSSAFFRSPEFQGRGYFVYRFYPVAFGRKPDYAEFTPDLAKVSGGTRTRANVLREVSESSEVYNRYYNQAFVVIQYFGYLRRDPDALYLNWIAHLDASDDYRSMISGFVNSVEYRARFGP